MASGYFIGAAALMSLDVSESVLFVDEGAHFSLLDAARTTMRPVVSFRHTDPEALAEALRASLPPRMRPVVLTDGVFATIGRVAPLDQYANVLADYDGRLVVDEAHSFGVLGEHGRGAADYHRVEEIATSAGTLSKALCAQGAIIGCSIETADRLRRVPPLRGANAGSPISAAVGAAAIRYTRKHPERRVRLAELAGYLRSKLRSIGIDVAETPAPILAFRIGDRTFMRTVQKRLLEMGIFVLVSNYIGAGEGIIRCAVFADHTQADLDALADSLSKL
jgi:7-keto-8-aminopelargonate synthetase-like enzyme